MNVTQAQTRPDLGPAALQTFRESFTGELITPDDPAYGEARRVWNGMIDRYPAVVARCTDTDDVASAIAFARDRGLPIAVRGGGHSLPGLGTCDGGVVVDLAPMRTVQVDTVARRARVGGGATWGELDRATQAHGLAVTGGLVTHTGVGGLTLGGGIGHLMRRCGLTCDNLVGAEVVTADGATLLVSEDRNADLLWGLRGGGGNFGVVTQFEYQLHEVGATVIAGVAMYPLTDGREVLRFYRDWVPDLPDAMTTILVLRAAPAAPFLPAEVHGKPVVAIVACWSGPLEDAESALAPLRRFRRPLVDLIAPKPYLEHQSMFDPAAPAGLQNYMKTGNLAGLSDAAIDVLVDHAQRTTSPLSVAQIYQLGGAVSRVAEDATAYSDRGAMFNAVVNAQWPDPHDPRAEEHVRWVRNFHAALQPFTTGGAYVNFLMNEGQDRVRAAYGAAKYARLVQLKLRYDPGNIFRLNQNIRPEP